MTEKLTPLARQDIGATLHPFTNLSRHEETGPLVITRGQGIYVYDEAGKEYIEGMAGLWCTALGFGEEELVKAAADQMRRLPYYHMFSSKSHDVGIRLADRLKAMAPVPMSKVFFVNSGSEANDTVVKMVWYYNNALERPKKKKIIARMQAYHGVTMASASLTGLPLNHRDFDLPIAGILHTDSPHYYRFAQPGESEEAFSTRLAKNLDELIQREGPDTVAAFIAEPVMGAGGVIVPPATYFEKIQAVLKKHDVLLVADEVICGFHRTGNAWGSQTYQLKPDLLVCAKQLSSGYLPIAAVMVSEAFYKVLSGQSRKIGVFAHGFTYSGHPVAAAVAERTLQLYEERRILEHVRKVSPRLQQGLRALAEHPLVGNVRGVGLIGALELIGDKATRKPFDPAQKVGVYASERCQGQGLIVRPLVDSLAICPPLIITEAQVDELLLRLRTGLDETLAWVRKGK